MNELAIAAATIAVNALVTWGVVKATINFALREIHRAHKRLDLMGARNWTPDDAPTF